jgi:hypothetical protein
MNNLRKAIALLLSLCLMAGAALSLAESAAAIETEPAATEVTEAVPVATVQLAATDVVARVNGADVLWGDVEPYYASLVNYYGEPDASMIDMYRAFAMETAIVMVLSQQTAAANGLDQYTDEEKAALELTLTTDWQTALDNWVSTNAALSDTATEEEKAAAYQDAEAYYLTLGYDLEKLREDYLERDIYDRAATFVTKDVVVTDEEITAQYEQHVAGDQALYENDVDAYEQQVQLYNMQYASELPWYHPAGYRYIKHILLDVDTALMSRYTDLAARLEEQMSDETQAADDAAAALDLVAIETAAEVTAAPETTQTPVTQADVDTAKADILASVQAKVEEINQKIADGEDFDALIAQYAVKADGSATDPGMTGGSYPDGYEVSLASASFVPAFVEAAFSVSAIGDVSAPYISDYGVHIIKYMADVPAGPVALTDALKDTIRTTLKDERDNAAMDAWQKAAAIEYTGLVPSMASLQTEEDTAAE